MTRQFTLVKAEAFTALNSRLADDLPALLASVDSFTTGERILTLAEGYSYEVVDSGEHLMTAGGARLKLLPDAHGRYHALALNQPDIGAACNMLFADVGDNCHVHVGPGIHSLLTPIVMNQAVGSHLILSGEGHLATTLQMPAGASMIGIDAQTQDEATIRNIRVIEGPGSQTCLCVLVGGTSGVLHNVWAGNAKTGFVACGANSHWNDIWCEACSYGLIVASRFCDFEVGMTVPVTSVSAPRFHQLYCYNCGTNNLDRRPGLYITHFRQATISSVSGAFELGETITGSTSGSTGIVFSSNGTNTLILEDAFDAFSIGESITGSTSGATATLDGTNMNIVRGPQFTALALSYNDRYGAIIEGADGVRVQGTCFGNGTNAGSLTAGIRIGRDAQVSLAVDLLDNGPKVAGHSGNGYGLYLDGSGANVSCVGGTWSNSQTSDQDYAFRRGSGTLTLSGVNVSGNAIGAKYGASAHTARGCIGTPDSNVDLGSEEVEKATSHSVANVNAETDTLVSARAISTRDVHVWRIWQLAANGTLQSLRKLVVYNNAGTISATEIEDFDNGTSSAAIVDNANNTYDVTVTNGSANNREFFGRLEEIVSL